jgi:hypothetical protein
MNKLKEGDIIRWHYTAEELARITQHTSKIPYWCNSQIGEVKLSQDGSILYIEDTYWSSGHNKLFTINDDLDKLIDYEIVGNYGDLVQGFTTDRQSYKAEDLLDLSHSNCSPRLYRKRDAVKCIEVMQRHKEKKIAEIKARIANLERDLVRLVNLEITTETTYID